MSVYGYQMDKGLKAFLIRPVTQDGFSFPPAMHDYQPCIFNMFI